MPEATDIPTVQPSAGGVYRVGHHPNPFAPVPWWVIRQRTGGLVPDSDDQTIGGRFDDPAGRRGIAEARRFRMIYCASQRVAAFGESIEPFRGDLSTEGAVTKRRSPELQAIIERNPELKEAAGVVSFGWLQKRRIGRASLDPTLRFVDLTKADTLEHLRIPLGQLAASLGFRRIDHGAIFSSSRRFTQEVASYFYEQLDPHTDEPIFDGLYYCSTLDLDWECWAVFDRRSRPVPSTVTEIEPTDPDLTEAADRYGLTIEMPAR